MRDFMNFFMRMFGMNVYQMSTLELVGTLVSSAVGLLFTVLYFYQFVYVFVAIIHKPKKYPETDQTKRYGVIIAARNEEKVLPELLKSIKGQTYPAENISIFVVADNCTDATAEVARTYGATVYERFNKEQIGKGYALEFLFNHIKEDRGIRACDAYIVLDADNVLRNNYIAEMDKAHCAGNRVLTSYRNSKNYGKNWISAGYALWFLRESRHLNNPRSILNTSAALSGTGFLVDSAIIEREGGWSCFLLTEDIQFTVDCILKGDRVGYCHDAELFDEQPETFGQSWRQRKRWAKGFFQVIHNYGTRLFKGSLKRQWSCFDMMMNIMPAFILSLIQLLTTTVLLVVNLVVERELSQTLLLGYAVFFVYAYGIFLLLGLIALITEWKKIHCPKPKAVLLLLSFPLFMMTYIPISLSALFSRVEWKPIEHKHAVSVDAIEQASVGVAESVADSADAAASPEETN